MKNKLNMIHITRFLLIPFLLLLAWLTLSIVFVPFSSLSSLSKYHSASNFNNLRNEKLLKGHVVSGFIESKFHNLGIIHIRINPSERVDFNNEDEIVFRIKNVNDKNWYAINKYKGGIFYENPMFPFGFPIINDSKNEKYYFELESTKGNKKNSISINKNFPVLVTQYKFNKHELLSDNNLVNFIFIKIFTSFSDLNFIILSLPYFLPFFLYILLLVFEQKILSYWLKINKLIHRKRYIFIHIVYFFILLDLLINFTNINSSIFVIFSLLWIVVIKYHNLDSSVTFMYSAIFFMILLLSNLLGNQYISLKSSSWLYIFLLIGTLDSIIALSNKGRKKNDYEHFLKKSFRL